MTMPCRECGATIPLPPLTRSMQDVACPRCDWLYKVALDAAGRPCWWRLPTIPGLAEKGRAVAE